MAKYLWRVRYTAEGARGLLADGGTKRSAAITKMVESVGGSVEACYFALGPDDLVVIGEVPDDVAAAALSVRTAAVGAAVSTTVPLLTAAQLDEAVSRAVSYSPLARSPHTAEPASPGTGQSLLRAGRVLPGPQSVARSHSLSALDY
jgi:uncharacterized protein with GYD domain